MKIPGIQKNSFPITSEELRKQEKRQNEFNKVLSEKAKINWHDYDIPYYDWTIKFRKLIEGKPNILPYLPMWHQIYRDEHPFVMLAIARQLGKTTYGGGKLAYYGTKQHTKAVYVTFSDESLRSFSNDKYRGSILHPDNPALFKTVKGSDSGKGAVSRVEFLSNSSTSLVSHANEFHHVEGKSADFLFYDEDQNLNLDALAKAKESQAWTHGKELFGGIGGYIGTTHHKMWLLTNQMEWKFSHEFWRDKLEYNDEGFVWDSYLIDLLAGEWIAKAPQNWTRHGYHLSQEMFPNIPLTIKDAVEKYKIAEDKSIEWKRQHYPASFFHRNVLANFVKGAAKPFYREQLMRLFDRNLSFTRPEDVNRSKGKIIASSDWGGGSEAFTVPLITQCLHPKAPIFKVLYIKKIDEPDVEKQADFFINLCNAYEADVISIDAGGGPRQAQKVEKMFADRCTRISYMTRPGVPLPTATEMKKLRSENRFTIDKTYSIDRLKDLIDNPYIQGKYAFPRFVIPAADLEKVGWIIDDFEAEEGELIKLKSTGQDYISYSNPPGKPDDALHSFNYNWIGQMLDQDSEIWKS